MSKRQVQYEHQDEEIQTKIKKLTIKNTENYVDKLTEDNVTTVYKLNHYCLAKIFINFSIEDRLKMEQGIQVNFNKKKNSTIELFFRH